MRSLDLPTGVVLITGPTGSGKTTSLYSSLNYCNSIETKIITAEDPVEYTIDGIIQCSIFDKVGRTFEATLREIVRQDPDIIVLGEIRDRVTAETAIQAALTGHKVYFHLSHGRYHRGSHPPHRHGYRDLPYFLDGHLGLGPAAPQADLRVLRRALHAQSRRDRPAGTQDRRGT